MAAIKIKEDPDSVPIVLEQRRPTDEGPRSEAAETQTIRHPQGIPGVGNDEHYTEDVEAG
jgi:hypothetical protein